jgi:hypothetical protein
MARKHKRGEQTQALKANTIIAIKNKNKDTQSWQANTTSNASK